jgi:hypothetical protein
MGSGRGPELAWIWYFGRHAWHMIPGERRMAFYKSAEQIRSDEHKTFILYATRSICLPVQIEVLGQGLTA